MLESFRISIITVSFNSEKTIAETIKSVISQDCNDYEYIIIDGKSTDNTVQIAESFREQFNQKGVPYTVISEKDKGIYDAMNKGILLAKGDIVGIINSDDYYMSGALGKVAKHFKETGCDVMYGDLRIFSDKLDFIKVAKNKKRFSTKHWNHPSMFVARHIYENNLYACESIYDDLNFILGVRNKGLKISVLNETLASFRMGGVSNEKSWKKLRERIKLRNAIYKKNNCKNYKLNNFYIEFGKYILTKRKK